MTATHAQIRQATGHLHDHIRPTSGGQTEDICDNPTPFDAGNHVFDDEADPGEQRMEELVPNAQLLATGLLLGCWVRTPAGS